MNQHPDQPPTAEQGLRWANDLPSEVLSIIAAKSGSAARYVTLRRVCKQWHQSLSMPPFLPLPSRQVPFLLVPPHGSDPPAPCPIGYAFPLPFAAPSQTAFFQLPQLQETLGCICVGSSHGWLISLSHDSALSLINPVTADSIHLPHLSSMDNTVLSFDKDCFPEYRLRNGIHFSSFSIVRRAVLSSDPVQDPGFTVLLFLSGLTKCCFTWRNGIARWHQHLHAQFLVEDVVFVKGVFAAIDLSINLAIFDFRNWQAVLIITRRSLLVEVMPKEAFLVESAGDLLLVLKWVNSGHSMMQRGAIKVFQIHLRRDVHSIMKAGVNEIGRLKNCVLFVGHGSSVCVTVDRFPWLAADTVYFTHFYIQPEKDDKVMHHGGVYKFTVRSKAASRAFAVGTPWYFVLWSCLKFYWVTPNLNSLNP
ncbi:hypothetical protein LUZ63_017082 [Rhynchospora breviuscula]|uniref:KIB1-4 beta-propeller domain-containing protein n=1 Tax=Rhynchospora breviuscula TaxID=2022672 RepID=A0A9Q0HF49_9POAL|nr:hypothetical protein LUZ63_017082 [Rhynchospora breviuscula]